MVLNILHPRFRFLTIIFFLFALSVNGQINGTFTIGGAQFPTIQSAINHIDSNGINGNVYFEIKNGVYNEQIEIGPISGASDSSRIFFYPENGASVIIQNQNTASANYILKMTGASFVEVSDISFKTLGTGNYNIILHYDSLSCFNVFQNCHFTGKKTTQSSINHSLIYSPAGNDSFNLFYNNTFLYGSYGFYITSDSVERGTQIVNNQFINQGVEAVVLSLQDSLVLHQNTIRTNSLFNQFIGFRMDNIGPKAWITSNDINYETDGFCILIDASSGDTINRILIANNFLHTAGNTAAIPLFIESSRFIDVKYNNMLVSSTTIGSAGRTINVQNLNGVTDNISFKYNNIVNHGLGYGLITFSTATTLEADYNNYYTPRTSLGYWNGFSSVNLTSWQTYTGQDAHSHFSDPGYLSNSNLHVYSSILDSAAVYDSLVTIDIDSQYRNTNYPDIGADEFQIYFKDLGITGFESPLTYCLGDSVEMIVKLKNFGNNTISQVEIGYEIQSQKYSTTKNINLLPQQEVMLKLKDFQVNTPTLFLKAYISKIDFNGDPNNENDTFQISLNNSLSGNFTINQSGNGDYLSFIDAIADLKERGVCGPVTFFVKPGTYREQLVIDKIKGASQTNFIRFIGETDQVNQTIITYDANNWYANYTLKLGADFISFEYLTIISENPVYGMVVDLIGKQKHIYFKNNKFYGVKTTSISYDYNIINKSPISNKDSFIVFDSNEFYFGSNGVYFYADANHHGFGNRFLGNKFENQSSAGLRIYGQKFLTVSKNIFYMKSSGTNSYGAYFQDIADSSIISKNNFDFPNGAYALYMINCYATLNAPLIVSNNFISVGGSTNNGYGIHVSGSRYLKIYHNSVNIYSSGYYSRALNLLSTNNGLEIYNNNLVNSDGGYVIYHNATGNIKSDYNNLFTTNGNFTYFNGNKNVLSSWQLATFLDSHSVSVAPRFISQNDLHTQSLQLDSAALKLADITSDYDDETRNANFPDIGADEYILRTNDAGITSFPVFEKYQCDGRVDISVQLTNYGIVNLDSVEIHREVNGVKQDTFRFYGLLPYLNNININIGHFYFNANNQYTIKAWTALPNGQQDELSLNDTFLQTNLRLTPYPDNLIVSNDSICFGDTAQISAFADYANRYYWYTESDSGTLLSIDSFMSFNGMSVSDTLFVEAGSISNPDSIKTVFEKVNLNIANGNMFDITAKNSDIFIDSLDVHTQYPSYYQLYIYYKSGTYQNFEGDSNSWTLLDTITVKGSGQGFNSRVKLRKSFFVPKGETYGIYITTNQVNYLIFSPGSSSYENTDIKLSSGKVLDYLFNAAFAQWATWNGQVYYSTGSICKTERQMAVAHVKKKAQINLPSDTVVCDNKELVLIADEGPDFTYEWQKYPGPVFYSNNQSITLDTSGLFYLKVSDGCGYHQQKVITVNSAPGLEAAFKIDFSEQCFDGNSFNFTNTSKQNGLNFIWDFGDGDTNNTKNATHSYNKADSFIVNLIATNQYQCIDSASKSIVVHPNPKAGFYFNDSIQCEFDNEFNLLNITTIKNGNIQYLWYVDDNLISSDTNLTAYHYPQIGNLNIKLIATSDFNCSDSIIRTAFIKPSPEFDLGEDTTLCADQHIILIPGFGFDSYLWSNDSTDEAVRIDTNGLGLGQKTIWLRVEEDGCFRTDTILITFEICGSIEDNFITNNIKVYPNPAINNIFIENSKNLNVQQIQLFDMNGKIVISSDFQSMINLSGLSRGIYLLRIITENETGNFIIQKL
jgi:hypothetical protein